MQLPTLAYLTSRQAVHCQSRTRAGRYLELFKGCAPNSQCFYRFTSFATYLLHNPSFNWTITSTVRVTALNIIFDGVELTKDISFKAFNNLPGVTISNFDLPSDDPAGGITISTDSTIPSPSNLGIDLGYVLYIYGRSEPEH